MPGKKKKNQTKNPNISHLGIYRTLTNKKSHNSDTYFGQVYHI